jgi:hypothetical protein
MHAGSVLSLMLPRNKIQRRATVSGYSSTYKHVPVGIELFRAQIQREMQCRGLQCPAKTSEDSASLRLVKCNSFLTIFKLPCVTQVSRGEHGVPGGETQHFSRLRQQTKSRPDVLKNKIATDDHCLPGGNNQDRLIFDNILLHNANQWWNAQDIVMCELFFNGYFTILHFIDCCRAFVA